MPKITDLIAFSMNEGQDRGLRRRECTVLTNTATHPQSWRGVKKTTQERFEKRKVKAEVFDIRAERGS